MEDSPRSRISQVFRLTTKLFQLEYCKQHTEYSQTDQITSLPAALPGKPAKPKTHTLQEAQRRQHLSQLLLTPSPQAESMPDYESSNNRANLSSSREESSLSTGGPLAGPLKGKPDFLI